MTLQINHPIFPHLEDKWPTVALEGSSEGNLKNLRLRFQVPSDLPMNVWLVYFSWLFQEVGANHPHLVVSSAGHFGKTDIHCIICSWILAQPRKYEVHFTQMVESNQPTFPGTVGLFVLQFNQLSIHQPGFDNHSPAWIWNCLVEPSCFPNASPANEGSRKKPAILIYNSFRPTNLENAWHPTSIYNILVMY